jgi:hypothetical protein
MAAGDGSRTTPGPATVTATSTGAGGADGGGGDRHMVDQLSAYLEGDMKPRAAEIVRAHLDRCGDCARAADEIRAIVAGARSLERPEPPPTLWSSIEGALAERDVPLLDWRRFFVRGFAAGGLAGAAAVLLLLLGLRGGGLWSRPAPTLDGPGAPAGVADARLVAIDPLLQEAENELETAAASYERSIAKLRSLLARLEEPRWSADVRARFLESVMRLDDAIDRSRAAARSTPGDGAGNEMLFAAYRSKIDFLAAAVHRGGPEEVFHEGLTP